SIKILTNEVETLKEEKDVVDGKLVRLLKSSKDLENIIESQRSDKVKEGVGYNAVPPPVADLYLSPKKDLSWTGLPEYVDDTVTDYSRPSPTVVSTSAEDQNKDTSTSEDVASPNPPKPFVKFVKPKDSQPESKSKEQETHKKSQVKYANQNRHSNKRPKGNQRNWNNLKSYQLGPEFVLHKKPCFNCGDFSHLANDCRRRVQRETNRPNGAPMRPTLRSSSPRPHGDSMRSSFRPAGHRPNGPSMNPRRPTMNGARPYKSFFQAPSYETRPFLKSSAVKNSYRAPWVPTVNRYDPPVNRKFSTSKRNFPTANRKFPTASRKFTTSSTRNHTAGMGRKGKPGSSQNNIDDKGYWDSGCSRHMTGNISYLSNFEPFDGGYVSFGQGGCKITGKGTIKTGKLEFKNGSSQNNIYDKGYWDSGCSRHMTGNISHLSDFEPFDRGYVSSAQGGCKITGKGTIKTSKLKFENVYFVKDLKYNLFSVSQIYDNKNSVLFIDSECIVLGRDFKLLDDANILLRTPRQHNMYSIDMNNIVPHIDLTCLVAKASANECTLWHRRLESSSSKPQDGCSPEVSEGSGNINPTTSTTIPPADQMETLTVETSIPTVSSPIPTACLNDSLKPSSDARLISKRVANEEETPFLDNILSLTNRFKDILGVESSPDEIIGVEVDVNNMEITITASPTPTLRIHKDHPKSQIISPMDTLIQTKHKSKEVEEQSFIDTIHQMTDPALLQFCLFSCFLSQVEPKKVSDALQDPS
nr:ribonuclease H-like domain-containing protein [Tanacetum cinerariifolium]